MGGESCGECFSESGFCGTCQDGLACKCIGDCANPMIADAPATCVAADATFATTTENLCSLAFCPEDICPDGQGRRQIGNDCCACPALRGLGESCGECFSESGFCGTC